MDTVISTQLSETNCTTLVYMLVEQFQTYHWQICTRKSELSGPDNISESTDMAGEMFFLQANHDFLLTPLTDAKEFGY